MRRLGQAERRPNIKVGAACYVGSAPGLRAGVDPTYYSLRLPSCWVCAPLDPTYLLIVAALGFLLASAPLVAQPASPPSERPSAETPSKSDRRAAEKERRGRPGNLIGHGGPIKALAVDAASGRALTGSFDYAMMLWDVSAEAAVRLERLDDHDGAVNAVAFVPGGTLAVAAGDDARVAVWDLATGKLAHRFNGHTAKITGLVVSADGKWAASASWDRTARLWDLERLAPGP